MEQDVVIGPPGTGKTTYCLQLVEDALREGVAPDRIGFFSFTRKAAQEAIQRACNQFSYGPDDLPYFRTLHSLAYQELGLSSSEVMDSPHYRELGDQLGMVFHSHSPERLVSGQLGELGEKVQAVESLSRIRQKDLYSQWQEQAIFDLPYAAVEQYSRALHEYKMTKGLVDYIDMIDLCESILHLELMIVDEAQDLTPQQYSLIYRLCGGVKRLVFAGDDMQAIFTWAGADVGQFRSLKGNKRVLPTSYRLPQEIYQLARTMEGRIHLGYDRTWQPREEAGRVDWVRDPYHLDMAEGTWLLLCRNTYQLKKFERMIEHMGYPYVCAGKSSIDRPEVRAVLYYEQMRKGETASFEQASLVIRYAGTTRTLPASQEEFTFPELGIPDMPWYEALKGINVHTREYIRGVLRRGESLTREPRIQISTIHGSKGGQADQVVLQTDMAYTCWQSMNRKPDDEIRVFYTGITRAKKNLWLIQPTTLKHFNLL